MANWWERKEVGNKEEITLPREIQEQLDGVNDLKTQVSGLETKLGALDSITSWIEEQKVAAEAAKKPVFRGKTQEELAAEDEELGNMLVTDPRAAINKVTEGTNKALLVLAAKELKRETFSESPQEFEYYAGDIKTEVDRILSEQSLEFQCNPEAVKNTYYTVVGRKQKEINEGKIKSRFSSSSNPRTSEIDGGDGRPKITQATPDIEKAAKLTGQTVEDYLKMLNENVEAYI
jgi:hypothetical protein